MCLLRASGPLLILAAHPDDETAGAGGFAAHCAARGRPVHVLFLTDGAPRQRQYFAHDFRGGRAAYRRRRRAEALAAAQALGLAAVRLHFVSIPDLELRDCQPRAMARLRAVARASGARAWLVPARENGHPDHDAANEVARQACRHWARGATVWEYPLYARHRGQTRYAWFPPGPGVIQLALNRAEHAAKVQALTAYRSQRATLAPFLPVPSVEQFRPLRRRRPRRHAVWTAWGWELPPATRTCGPP